MSDAPEGLLTAEVGAAGTPVAPITRATCAGAMVLFLLVSLNGAWWARAIPENGAPDEYEHIATQRFVAENGRLPRFGEGRFRIHLMDSVCREPIYPRVEGARMVFRSGMEIHEGHRYEVRQPYLFSPQLAHLLGGTMARMTGGFALWKARMVSAVWIAAASSAVFLAGRQLWPGRLAVASLAGVIFGFWPQAAFLGGYVNDDAFAVLTTALLLLVCSRIESAGASWRNSVALGVVLGLVALSKPYASAIFPLIAFWMIRLRLQRGKVAPRFLLSCAIALAVVGSWFAFSVAPSNGDGLVRATRTAALQDFVSALPAPLARQSSLLDVGSLSRTGHSILEFPFGPWFLVTMFSFYGAFGWMDEPFPLVVYFGSALFFSAAIAGLMVGDRERRPPVLLAPFLFSFPFLAAIALLSIGHAYFFDFQPQGRYLLPSVPGISMLAAAGASSFPGRLGGRMMWSLVVFMLGVNLYARLFVLH